MIITGVCFKLKCSCYKVGHINLVDSTVEAAPAVDSDNGTGAAA